MSGIQERGCRAGPSSQRRPATPCNPDDRRVKIGPERKQAGPVMRRQACDAPSGL